MKEKVAEFFTGNVTVTKKEFWLTVTSCTLLGVLIGILYAPFSRGISIGNNNGNNNVASMGGDDCDNCAEDTESVGVYEV